MWVCLLATSSMCEKHFMKCVAFFIQNYGKYFKTFAYTLARADISLGLDKKKKKKIKAARV